MASSNENINDFLYDFIINDGDSDISDEEEEPPTPLQKYADDFTANGRVVFPIDIIVKELPCGKLRKDYPKTGWKNITRSEAVKKESGLAVVRTGDISGITVIDFDTEDAWESVSNQIADCYTVKTRKGYHVYFSYCPELKSGNKCGLDPFPDIDIKNDGEHITIPGSSYRMPNGRIAQYWLLTDGVIREVPQCIKDMLKTPKGKPAAVEPDAVAVKAPVAKETSDIEDCKKLANLISIEYIDMVEPWRECLWALRTVGVDRDWAETWSKQSNEFDDRTMSRFWDAASEATKSYGIGTLYHYAKQTAPDEARRIRFPRKKANKEVSSNFDDVSKEFEARGNAKLSTGNYLTINEANGDAIIVNKKSMIERHEHLAFTIVIDEEESRACFIKPWITANKNIKMFVNADVFPPGRDITPGWANIWSPFACERIQDYTPVYGAGEFMENHIKILCDNDEATAEWLNKWIAHALQKPSEKPKTMPIIVGNQGCGKSSIGQLLKALVGRDKTADLANASAICQGGFNGRLLNSYMVIFNELSKSKCEVETMKNTITEPEIDINEKCQVQVKISSFHRLISFTNNEDPIQTSNDDRRMCIIQASDELCKNINYFNKFYQLIENTDSLKTIYEHYKTMDIEDYIPTNIPRNAFHEELKEVNMPIEVRWMRSLANDNEEMYELADDDAPEISNTATQWIKIFNNWKTDNSIVYDLNAVYLSRRMMLHKFKSITRRRTNCGSQIIINTASLIKEINDKFDLNR